MGFLSSLPTAPTGCLLGLLALQAARVLADGEASAAASNPFISSKLLPAEVANVTSKVSECLAARVGAMALDVDQMLTDAATRRSLATGASSKERYVVVLQESMMEDVLPATLFEEHGHSKFKPMGSSGCYLVTMDSATATSLLQDPHVALTMPLPPKLKADPASISTIQTITNNAVASSQTGVFASTFQNISKDISSTASTVKHTAVSTTVEMLKALTKMGKKAVSKANVTVDGSNLNALGGGTTTPAVSEPLAAMKPADIISFHVTLADADDVDETLKSWKAQLSAEGLDVNGISFEATPIDLQSASTLSTRYVVAKAPATLAFPMIELLSAQPQVDWIESTPRLSLWNKWARGITQSGDWQVQPLTQAGLDGTGQVVGIADTGMDTNSCFLTDTAVQTPFDYVSQDHRKLVTYIGFADRMENYDQSPNSNDPIGHGTHVSGTVAGNTRSSMSVYNGMAPSAKLAFFDIAKYDDTGAVMLYPPPDLNQGMFVQLYNAGARVMSMSWGSPDSNCYSSYAVMVDEFLWNHPDALIVFAAGNSGQNGDYSVVTPSTAKNCLTVGASYNMIQSTFQLENNLDYIAYFSSIGPTSDGRLKPDVLAPGYYITSAHNGDQCGVVMSRGTSMATPVVAGNVALVRQFFMSGRYMDAPLLPSGALLKAMLIHSGQPMTAYEDEQGSLHPVTYPDHYQGYGRIELDQVLDTGSKTRFTMLAFGSANGSDPRYRIFNKVGDVHQYTVTIVNTTGKVRALKATLVWTDRPSSAASCTRSTNSVLTNDLDLTILGPDNTIYYPQSGDEVSPDHTNNVEQVSVPNPIPGANYTIAVKAYGLVASQPYALVFTGQFIGQQYDEDLADLHPPSGIWADINSLFKGDSPSAVLLVVAIILAAGVIAFFVQRRLRGAPSQGPSQSNPPTLYPQQTRRSLDGDSAGPTLHTVDLR